MASPSYLAYKIVMISTNTLPSYPTPLRRDYPMDGGTLSAVHFGRVSNPLKLVFLHANGFNAMSYRSVLEPLGVHTAAIDLRGHGFTNLPDEPSTLKNWHVFRDDIAVFFEAYVDRPVVLAGHSFGAVSGILAAEKLGSKCAGFVGFDPVMMPQPYRALSATKAGRNMMKKRIPIAAKAGRRRATFDSTEAAFENYQGRGMFKKVSGKIIQDYLKGGLIEGENSMRLACEPLWEQAIFCAQNQNSFKAARFLPQHRKIIFAGKNSPTPFSMQARMKARLGRENVQSSSKLDHLFPLQEPHMAMQILADMLKTVSLTKQPKPSNLN